MPQIEIYESKQEERVKGIFKEHKIEIGRDAINKIMKMLENYKDTIFISEIINRLSLATKHKKEVGFTLKISKVYENEKVIEAIKKLNSYILPDTIGAVAEYLDEKAAISVAKIFLYYKESLVNTNISNSLDNFIMVGDLSALSLAIKAYQDEKVKMAIKVYQNETDRATAANAIGYFCYSRDWESVIRGVDLIKRYSKDPKKIKEEMIEAGIPSKRVEKLTANPTQFLTVPYRLLDVSNTLELNKRYGKKSIEKLRSEYNLDFLGRYPMSVLEKMYKNKRQKKPLGILVFAKNDPLDTFYMSIKLVKNISEKFDLRIVEVDNETSFSRLLEMMYNKNGKFDFLLIAGHGSADSITLGRKEGSKEDKIDATDEDLLLEIKEYLDLECNVFLVVCKSAGSIAEKISKTLNRTLFAPTTEVKIPEGIEFEEGNNKNIKKVITGEKSREKIWIKITK